MTETRFKAIPIVYLFLMKRNRVLLSRRYNTGFHDEEFSFLAGHLKLDETLIQAIIREARKRSV
jgi:8-oxo-dGTP pyrophosphatase MutT (NUDIX family)